MLSNYLKIAFRTLRKQRSHTLLNVVGLAVGMAGGLLIFLFVRYHLSTDRHHAKFDRVFRIVTDLHLDDGSVEYGPEAPVPLAEVLRRDFPQVEQAAFLRLHRDLTVSPNRVGEASPTRFLEHEGIGFVEPEWFGILDYRWLVGNPRASLSQPNSVVLTESWARRYFGTANPIGRVLTLNGSTQAKVTGLLADPPTNTDTNVGLFVSLPTLKRLDPGLDLTDWYWNDSPNRVYIVLRDDAAAGSLQAALPALVKKYYGSAARVFHLEVQPLRDVHFDVRRAGGVIRESLLWSLGAVGVLLVLVACVNFVNLATAQALRRGKEVGIRKTLGSSRGQLVRQFLLETTLIVTAALGLALLLVGLTLPVFNDWVQVKLTLQPDRPTLAFVGVLTALVILLAGGYPALVLSGFNPWAALRGTLRAGGGYSVRQVLVVGQFAVCQVLILGALVVTAQLRYVQRADLGFRKENVVLVPLPDQPASTQQALKQRLSELAGVQSVSFSFYPPSSEKMNGGPFKFEGRADWEKFPVRERFADAEYLRTYGLQLVAGRNLAPSDTIREYLVNETLARKLGFRDPKRIVGRTLQYHASPVSLPIVGVVKDFHLKSLHEPIAPGLIASNALAYRRAGIRISGNNPAQTLQNIQKIWQEFYPSEVFEHGFLDEQLARFYTTETLMARLANVFTGLVILISCLGLYGLVSYSVVQRTKEIGVRKVLGASVTSIVTLLSKDFLKLILLAVVIASPLAWYLLRGWLRGFAYRIDLAWWYFAGAGVLAVGIALLTVSFQSVKAALTNPVKSLRSE